MADRNKEAVMSNLNGLFWTRQDEMVEEIESLNYEVISEGWDRLVVIDTNDEDETEYILRIGHANRTMWIEGVE